MSEHGTDKPNYEMDTLAVRAGIERSQFGEHSEALFLTSSYIFKSAAEAAARFSNAEPGMVYSRYTNPTVAMLEAKLAALEEAPACAATASGMSAILATAMMLLKAGDHLLCSASVFGATMQLFNNILGKFGVETTYVEGTDPAAFRTGMKPNTKMVFVETPSNPLCEVFDIGAIGDIARKGGAKLVIDNCFCSPALQQPLKLGADIVIHSATKYLDGQGRVLGGAVLGQREFVDGIVTFLRNAGPTLSPFNAWIILKGLDTLRIRMDAQSASALELSRWLEKHPRVERVYYPGLESHRQHALAMRQQRLGGAIVSFDVKGGKDAAWKLIDSTRMISITANLGDTKSTITHPGTTTHGRLTPEARAKAGIKDGLVRVAVGLEALKDIREDLERGLA